MNRDSFAEYRTVPVAQGDARGGIGPMAAMQRSHILQCRIPGIFGATARVSPATFFETRAIRVRRVYLYSL